jgi:microcystin-dependent protein
MPADPFIGQIMLWPINYAPRGWAFCDGQLLSISQNTALFAILGTTYGGNGRTTFALPDLRGRVPVHQGRGNNLTLRELGEVGGQDRIVVSNFSVTDLAATEPPRPGAKPPVSTHISKMPPFLTISYVIALAGFWPARP